MLQIVICEDNEKILNYISSSIQKAIKDNNIIGEIVCKANNPYTVEEFLKYNPANVFFVDIDLKASETGFSLATRIRERDRRAYIVFTTAHLEYVLQSFKVKPFDFLPKPVTDEILEKCLVNIYEDYLLMSSTHDEQFCEIKSGATLYRIKQRDVVYIEKLDSKTIIHLVNGKIQCTESLESLENLMGCTSFSRCHKSFICNRNYIREIRVKTAEIVFETGHVCLLGRRYKKELIGNV